MDAENQRPGVAVSSSPAAGRSGLRRSRGLSVNGSMPVTPAPGVDGRPAKRQRQTSVRKKITGVDALTHGVAENARWALHVAGAVAGVGIAWFYMDTCKKYGSACKQVGTN